MVRHRFILKIQPPLDFVKGNLYKIIVCINLLYVA